MGLGVTLIVIAVGAILTWAVHPAHPGSVDVHVVGVILMVVGFVGFVLDLLFWSELGPGYVRRHTVVEERGALAPRRSSAYPHRRRTVVEDDDPMGPPPP